MIGCDTMYELGEFGYEKANCICLFWWLYTQGFGFVEEYRYVGEGLFVLDEVLV